MKVLHVLASLSPSWGGPVSVVAGAASALAERGVAYSALATYGPLTGDQPPAWPQLPASTFRTDLVGRVWIGHAAGMATAMRRHISGSDLVHIHELWHYPHWLAARVALAAGVPYIISPHGTLTPWALRQRRRSKRVYARALLWPSLRRANAMHALTETEATQVRNFGIRAPVLVVPNGVPGSTLDIERAGTDAAQVRDVCAKQVVLFLGRVQPQKGPDVLIEAWSYVAAQRPAAQLVLGGPADAATLTALRERVRRLGLETSITFCGPLFGRSKEQALAAADLFVLPSRSEGQSVALLEAMAAGLPVVVTPVANAPDVVAAHAGLVSPLSAPQFGQAILQVLTDEAFARRLGANGRALVERQFTWERIAPSLEQMYAAVLAQRAGATT